MHLSDSSASDPLRLLHDTITRIEGAYSPATIRAYFADFAAFIAFCELHKHPALPANPMMVCSYIAHISTPGRSSASVRQTVVGISAIHLFNRMIDPTKNPEARIAMKRMYRNLGRAAKQAYGMRQEALNLLLAAVGDSIQGLGDAALLQLAYDTLCRRNELITLRIDDLVIAKHGIEIRHSILLRKSKVDQVAQGRWLPLRPGTVVAIGQRMVGAKINTGLILRGLSPNGEVTNSLCNGQIGRIYKRVARQAKLDPELIARISRHSFRVGAAQDLLESGASMPTIMHRGRWTKSDTVMRYLGQFAAIE
jgi:site-specific recombinase XerD